MSPTSEAVADIFFDEPAADAVDNLAASIYSLLTPPESLWVSLVPESPESPNADIATLALRANLNDSNFYTTIHQCYMDLIILGTACLFMAENPIGSASAFSFTAIHWYGGKGKIRSRTHRVFSPKKKRCSEYYLIPITLMYSPVKIFIV